MWNNYSATSVLFCFQNPEIRTICVDLSDWAATTKSVEEIGPIDLLVNNAGMGILDAFLDAKEVDISKYESHSRCRRFKGNMLSCVLFIMTRVSSVHFHSIPVRFITVHVSLRMLNNIG